MAATSSAEAVLCGGTALFTLFRLGAGGAWLAMMEPDRRRRMLDTLNLPAMTEHTITARSKLEAEIAETAKRGYGTDDEEFILGLVAIAVPVTDPKGRLIGAVACHAARARLDLTQALQHLERLQGAALDIGRTLD